MIDKVKLKVVAKLKNHPNRLKHVMGVYQTALKLAKIYEVDKNRVGVAALYHDFAKYDKIEKQIESIAQSIVAKYQKTPVIYHAYASAQALINDFAIIDEDVLNAIRFHVWGRKDMSMIEKIIFVSDACDPSRTFKNAPVIFELATKNINQAVELSMRVSIAYLEEKEIVPSKEQISIYRYYKELNSEEN